MPIRMGTNGYKCTRGQLALVRHLAFGIRYLSSKTSCSQAFSDPYFRILLISAIQGGLVVVQLSGCH